MVAVEALVEAPEALDAAAAALEAALPSETLAAVAEAPATVAELEASLVSAVKALRAESEVALPPPPGPRNIVKLVLLLLS